MTQTRITLTLTTLIAALFALLLIAALVGGTASPADADASRSSGGGLHASLPWDKAADTRPMYARTVYREHHMCDEVRHPAKNNAPALKP